MTRKLAAALVIALSCALPVAAATTFTTIENIEWARIGTKSLQLDLRVPDGNGPWPVVVYLHSGAWITGDRMGGPAIREAERGYAVASIDYPLAPQFVWPSQIEACKAAVRWLRANAERFHLDATHIAAFGTSAGGHLAAMLGTASDQPSLEGPQLGNLQFSSRVTAVVDFYGPTDLLKMDQQKLPCYGDVSANSPFMPPSLLMGCAIQECRDKTATSNPINYVTPDAPPFLILQGQADCLVPWQQSQLLFEALRSNGVSSQLYLLPTAGHADAQFNEPAYQRIVDEFLDRTLRGIPPKRRAVRSP